MEKSHVGMFNCFYCNEPMGVLLDRRLKKSLPMNCGAYDLTPCSKCEEWMKKGIILISIADSTTEEDMKGRLPNPYRTGGWAVVKQEVIENLFSGRHLEHALKHRFAFITDEAWDKIGIPREDIPAQA